MHELLKADKGNHTKLYIYIHQHKYGTAQTQCCLASVQVIKTHQLNSTAPILLVTQRKPDECLRVKWVPCPLISKFFNCREMTLRFSGTVQDTTGTHMKLITQW